MNDNNNADDNDKGKMIDENGPSDGDRILLIIQVKYFFISFKGKRGCLTCVTNNSEIKFTCIKEIQSKSAQYELIPQALFK